MAGYQLTQTDRYERVEGYLEKKKTRAQKTRQETKQKIVYRFSSRVKNIRDIGNNKGEGERSCGDGIFGIGRLGCQISYGNGKNSSEKRTPDNLTPLWFLGVFWRSLNIGPTQPHQN